MKAFVFPGQGAQFVGMGKDLYEKHPVAKQFFEKANEILGFRITDIMFNGTDEELKQTKVTQPAVYIHSVVKALCLGESFNPDMVAGHSLGEFSALTAARCLSFEDGLKLVAARAKAMQAACEVKPGTMAAIISLSDEKVEDICKQVSKDNKLVVPANYNCPGQLVISGDEEAIKEACTLLKEAGAKRALVLPVAPLCNLLKKNSKLLLLLLSSRNLSVLFIRTTMVLHILIPKRLKPTSFNNLRIAFFGQKKLKVCLQMVAQVSLNVVQEKPFKEWFLRLHVHRISK